MCIRDRVDRIQETPTPISTRYENKIDEISAMMQLLLNKFDEQKSDSDIKFNKINVKFDVQNSNFNAKFD